MRKYFALMACALFVSVQAWAASAETVPRGPVEPLMAARDVFYVDVQRFQGGELTETQLVDRIAEQFARPFTFILKPYCSQRSYPGRPPTSPEDNRPTSFYGLY